MREGQIDVLEADDPVGFAGLIGIYREAIEASEQKPSEAIAAYLRDPRYVVLVSRAGPQVTGFAMAFMAQDKGFWLLDYMAVARSLRSRGLGAALFAAAREAVALRAGALPCVVEIDNPSAQLSSDNKAVARVAFYARQGCRRLRGIDYILPLDVAGAPPPMQLLVHGLPGEATVPRQTVRAWLETIYVGVYGCAATDPRIAQMLQNAAPAIPLDPL